MVGGEMVFFFALVVLIMSIVMEMLRDLWLKWGWNYPIASTLMVMLFSAAVWWLVGLWSLSRGPSKPEVAPSVTASDHSVAVGGDFIINMAPSDGTKPQAPRFSEKFDKLSVRLGSGALIEIPNVNGAKRALFALSTKGILGLVGTGFSNPIAGAKTTGFPEGGTLLAVAHVDDGQLFIDAEIFAGPDQPPMHLRNNELEHRPAEWDKNTDNKHALEIVNEHQVPVLQIVYSDEARVMLKGIFVSGNNAVVINDDGMRNVPIDKASTIVIKPIFKYPSWKYGGVYAEE